MNCTICGRELTEVAVDNQCWDCRWRAAAERDDGDGPNKVRYDCHCCGAPLPDDHVYMGVCHACREMDTGAWAKRAARWKKAAKRKHRNRQSFEASAALYQRLYAGRGAGGWWLVTDDKGTRSFESMEVWSPIPPPKIEGYTYSAAEALAWLRDGALPQMEG